MYIRPNGGVDTGNAIRKLHSDETLTFPVRKGVRPMTIICESGLYKMIMRSDKPEAEPFQDWVTRQVLPSIRNTGSYSLPSIQNVLYDNFMYH